MHGDCDWRYCTQGEQTPNVMIGDLVFHTYHFIIHQANGGKRCIQIMLGRDVQWFFSPDIFQVFPRIFFCVSSQFSGYGRNVERANALDIS